MTSHPYDALPIPGGGKLILTPCPGTKGIALSESIEQLRRAGADAIISMTPSAELEQLGVSGLPDAVTSRGMRWLQFPIEDDAAPGAAFEQAWSVHRDALCALIASRSGIAIHCRGGSGRTGFMAALVLRETGMDGSEADALVKRLRPNSLRLPDHVDYLAARDGRRSQEEHPQ